MNKLFRTFCLAAVISAGTVTVVPQTFVSPAFALDANCSITYRKRYLPAVIHKAYATTLGQGPNASNISCGYAGNSSSLKAAKAEALRQCLMTNKKFKDDRGCKVIYSK